MNKTIVIAAGVFAVLFAAVLFVPIGHKVEMQPLSPTLEGTFHKVEVDPNRTPEQAMAEADAVERKNMAVYAKMEGRQPPSDVAMIAASNDGPAHDGYVRYVTLDRSGTHFMEVQGQDISGMKVACFSMRAEKATRHVMALYDETRFVPVEEADLREWMFSGCADALRSGRDLNMTQFMTTMRDLLPKTPEFDKQRQQIATALTAKPRQG